MKKLDLKDYRTYILIILFFVISYISYLIVKPFVTPIILSLVIAYIFYPVYKQLNKRITNKNIASLIMAIAIIFLISVPAYYVTKTTSQEIFVTYLLTKQKLSSGFETDKCIDSTNIFCQASIAIKDFMSLPKTRYYVQQSLEKVQEYSVAQGTKLIVYIPKLIVDIFLTFFILFFIFRDRDELEVKIKNLIPLKRKHKKKLITKFNETLYATIFGTLMTALIQGIVAIIGYYIFGITSPILWGLLTGFFALIPILGTSIIWLPMSFYFIISGYIEGNGTMIGKGLGILLYGSVVISLIDNFVRPKIIGDKANIHPALVLVGVLGGIILLGAAGVIIGPIVLALFITFLQIYETEVNHSK